MKRNEIISVLKENKGQYVSGEVLSSLLGVTRTTVWNRIKQLRSEGYTINSSSKKGYMLCDESAALNDFEIKNNLNTEFIGKNVVFLETIDSTNDYAKKLARQGCEEGTVVIAQTQTKGRGRLGRSWESKRGKGIWMSVVLKPLLSPVKCQIITLAASVAVCDAIWDVFKLKAGIKWPNDIVFDGKKICGILTEINAEADRINYIIAGIGINVNQSEDDFGAEIRDKANSLKLICGETKDICLKPLIVSVLENFEKQYREIKNKNTGLILEKWKEYSDTMGKDISVVSEGENYSGTATGLTEEGRLIIRDDNGTTREILAGEISLRGSSSYWR